MAVIMGIFSMILTIVIPIGAILLLIWVYELKKNSQIQVEQNKKMIELLERIKQM